MSDELDGNLVPASEKNTDYSIFGDKDQLGVPENYELTAEQTNELRSFFNKNFMGAVDSMARICNGPKCVSYHRCPLVKAQVKLPMGETCPVDIALMNQMFRSIATDIDLDMNSSVDVGIVLDIIK